MTFAELVNMNRSCRTYDESRPVSRDELMYLVSLARVAPSASNRQPLKFFLSCDKETNALIQERTRWAVAMPEYHLPPEGHRPTGFIIICIDTGIASETAAARDVGIAAQTMMLGATDMGLAGCMLSSFDPSLHDALGIGESINVALVVAFGKRDEEIKLVDNTGSVKYYRDENGVHYVPKRTMDELIIDGGAK